MGIKQNIQIRKIQVDCYARITRLNEQMMEKPNTTISYIKQMMEKHDPQLYI
jgi:hypothetical protein